MKGELPPTETMEEDLKKYLSMNTYLDSEDPWFWEKLRYALPHRESIWRGNRRRLKNDLGIDLEQIDPQLRAL